MSTALSGIPSDAKMSLDSSGRTRNDANADLERR
jgi:hypothetical protein